MRIITIIMETTAAWTPVSVPICISSRGTIDDWNNVQNSSGRRSRAPSRREWHEGRGNVISTTAVTTIGTTARRKKKRQKVLSEKVADWFRAFLAFLFSNVGIVCLVVGYTIAGAFIFAAVEDSHSRRTETNYMVSSTRNHTAIQLWQLTTKENIFSEELWKAKVNTILQEYQNIIINAVIDGWDNADSVDNGKWSFAGAFLYSLTVITTIGYGNMCPRTAWGKVITIGYAIVGMPLFLLYLSNIGDILAKIFKWIYARCCLCRCRKRPRGLRDHITNPPSLNRKCQRNSRQAVRMQSQRIDKANIHSAIEFLSGSMNTNDGYYNNDDVDNYYDYDDDDDDEDDEDDDDDDDEIYNPQKITVPLTLCLGIMVGYVCGGALLFSKWEEWNFLDGSYFCFVSLSTIGFGDIVPGNKIYSGKGIELSFIFCSMYLMLGMALIAMCFNLMQEEVMAKIRSFTLTVKHIFRCGR